MLLNQGVQEIAGEVLEEKITNQVNQEIMRFMLKSDFIKRAMANDIVKGRDYWGQIFIKEGLAMLNEKDSASYTLLKGIIKGTVLQQLTKHIKKLHGEGNSKTAILSNLASVGLPMLSSFLTDIDGFTDTFLENFHERLAQKYGQDLAKMETNTSATEQPTETATEAVSEDNADQEVMYVMDAQERLDDDDLQLHDRYNGQEFSTQAKVTNQQVAIDPTASQETRVKAMGTALTSNVSTVLLGKVNQHFINPLTSLAAGAFMDLATSGITEHLREQREHALLAIRNQVLQNEQANKPSGKVEDDKAPIGTDHASQHPNTTQNSAKDDPSGTKVTASSASNAEEKESFIEGNTTDSGGYAAEIGMAIEYYKDGKYQVCIGTKNRCNRVIRLEYESSPNPTADNHGHWKLNDGTIVIDAGNDGLCLPNAIVAGMSESDRKGLSINSGKDLFNKLEAHRLANPDYALKSAMYYQALLYHDPNAL